MGDIVELAVSWFWSGFVERRSEGKPWWVWTFWTLSPLLVLGAIGGCLWLLLR